MPTRANNSVLSMPYRPPVDEFSFLLEHVVGFNEVQGTEKFSEATDDVTQAILTEAGKLCEHAIAPVQRNGDVTPARLENGVVRTSPGSVRPFKRSPKADGSA